MKPVAEALKEIGRLILFAIPGIVLGYFTSLPETQTTVIIVMVLRAVDKYIHTNDGIKANGIAPF